MKMSPENSKEKQYKFYERRCFPRSLPPPRWFRRDGETELQYRRPHRPLHVQNVTRGDRYTSGPLHAATDTLADCYTWRSLHLPTVTLSDRYDCRPLHLPTIAFVDRFTCQPLHVAGPLQAAIVSRGYDETACTS